MAIPSYLGQVHRADGSVEGTCFQVAPGVLVTAWHVLEALGAHQPESVVAISQLTGGEQFEATVLRTDPRHDLAVLTSDGHLAGSAKALGVSSEVRLGARIEVGGAAEVDGDPSVTVLEGSGTWQGQVIRDDAVQLNSVACNRVTPRMSGSPVRLPGDVVIGVVSGRYNSESAWLADAVWTASTEALEELLRDVAGAPAVQRSPLGSITDVVMTIESDSVRLSWDQIVVNGRHSGSTLALRAALDDADRARRLAKLPVREGASPEAGAPASTISAMRVVGERMAACFLPGTVGQRLADLLSRAAQEHAQIRLAIDADGRWGLPWEAMIPPGAIESLAMLPQVTVYRRSPVQSAARKLPGPLTIAVTIAAPTRGGGPTLDYERELRNVLAAVAGARHSRRGIAQIRIIPFATLAALRSALEAGDVHVLHLSGHGTPGAIVLEDDDGSAVQVSAEQLIAEAVPQGMMPPLISLAACHTNVQGSATERSFAADLAAHGARAVIATENSITDRYATAFFAQVYASLARSNDTDVVNAVSAARRAVQTALMSSTVAADQQLSSMEEWALVTVLTPSAPSSVLDTSAPSRPPDARSEQRLETTTQRRVGEFVGRRGLQRDLPPLLIASDLEDARPGGVLLHGLGGIGKTTLASELVRRVGERAGDVIVAEVYGEVAADALLQAVADAVRPIAMARRDQRTVETLMGTVLDGRYSALDRLKVLRSEVLSRYPVLLVVDNAESNLVRDGDGWTLKDEALASLLAQWLKDPGLSRLLITSRHPFPLPGRAESFLRVQDLGPLTQAETWKLIWSLPALEHLTPLEVTWIWLSVGGHPRALEYLDALLNRGQARFADVGERLRGAVRKRLGDRAGAFLRAEHTLDAAMAEAATYAADDVLLPELLAGLSDSARRLLFRLSVYREPVDMIGVLFQVGIPDESAEINPDVTAMEVVWPAPPLRAGEGLAKDLEALAAAGLVSLAEQLVAIHPWTASEVQRLADDAESPAEAQARAADYWRWRVSVWPQDWSGDVHDLLEARWHLLQAEDLDGANVVSEGAFARLRDRGEWDRGLAILQEMLRLLPASHPRISAYLGELGSLAWRRGEYGPAQDWYRQSLAIKERLGDQAGLSAIYQNLGILAQDRGEYGPAEDWYRQSLAIQERLGDQAGLSATYHSLGVLARSRGEYGPAEDWYRQSLAIQERLGDQAGLSVTYQNLGILAQDRGEYGPAEDWYRQSLAIKERLGDQAGLSVTYQNLGVLARSRGEYGPAEDWYRQSLAIQERLGDQAGLSVTYQNLGILAQARGEYGQAEDWYRQSLAIQERLGDQAGLSVTYQNLGILAQDRGEYGQAEDWYRQSLAIKERLGDQAGLAATLSQQGFLQNELGHLAEAIPLHLRALGIRQRLGVPQASIDVEALGSLRQSLGENDFRDKIAQNLDDQSIAAVIDLTDHVIELADADADAQERERSTE